jgi:outer membrane protein assembly factor BamB
MLCMSPRTFPAILLLVPLCGAADWPQWRGPDRDGHARDVQLPNKWPAKAPAAKWSASVGLGYSGPVVAGGKVFIMGRVDTREYCLAFDAENGKELWRVESAVSFKPPDATAGTGPLSTPTVDRDRVYFFGIGGMLHCVEIASGKVKWKHDCMKEYWGGPKNADGDDPSFPCCGNAAAPLVQGSLVIVPVGGKKAGAFTAFHRETGEIVWKALDDRSSYASPLIRSPGGVEQLIGFTGTRMVGLRLGDRKLLWEHRVDYEYDQTIITPVVWKNLVIVAGEKKPTVALRITGYQDAMKREVAWRSKDLQTRVTTPVVKGDNLIGYDDREKLLVCVNLANGETEWTFAKVAGYYHSLVAVGDTLFVLGSEGQLHILKISDSGCEMLAKWTLDESDTWAHLAIAGKRIFVKGQKTLFCYEMP